MKIKGESYKQRYRRFIQHLIRILYYRKMRYLVDSDSFKIILCERLIDVLEAMHRRSYWTDYYSQWKYFNKDWRFKFPNNKQDRL